MPVDSPLLPWNDDQVAWRVGAAAGEVREGDAQPAGGAWRAGLDRTGWLVAGRSLASVRWPVAVAARGRKRKVARGRRGVRLAGSRHSVAGGDVVFSGCFGRRRELTEWIAGASSTRRSA